MSYFNYRGQSYLRICSSCYDHNRKPSSDMGSEGLGTDPQNDASRKGRLC